MEVDEQGLWINPKQDRDPQGPLKQAPRATWKTKEHGLPQTTVPTKSLPLNPNDYALHQENLLTEEGKKKY